MPAVLACGVCPRSAPLVALRASKTRRRGTLFFEVARILNEKRPKAFLLENVKNLISHDRGRTFDVIMQVLQDELGYHVHYKVLDSKGWTCQHRERIYIVGFRDDVEFSWDDLDCPNSGQKAAEILEEDADARYVLSDKLWSYLKAYKAKHEAAGNGSATVLSLHRTPRGRSPHAIIRTVVRSWSRAARARTPRKLTP